MYTHTHTHIHFIIRVKKGLRNFKVKTKKRNVNIKVFRLNLMRITARKGYNRFELVYILNIYI